MFTTASDTSTALEGRTSVPVKKAHQEWKLATKGVLRLSHSVNMARMRLARCGRHRL